MTTPIQFLTANEWGMRWARPPVPQRMPVNVLYVHHTAGNPMRNLSAAEAFRRTNEQSINSMGLSATHYSMLVHEAADGTVTVGEARGEWTPAATRDRNTVSKAVAALGFYHPGHTLSSHPSDGLLDGIAWALHHCIRRGWNLPDSTVLGHRDSPPHPGRTACQGDFLHARTADVRSRLDQLIAGPPDPEPEPIPTEDDDMLFLGRLDTNPDLILVGNGVTAQRVRRDAVATFTAQMNAGLSRWRHPHRAGWPLITSMDQIATFNTRQLNALVGIEVAESANQP